MSQGRHAPTALQMAPNLSLHSVARRDCSTEHHNVHLSVAESFWCSGVRHHDLTGCVPIFTLAYFHAVKLHLQHTCWRLHHYHSSPCRLVGTERWYLDTTNSVWSLANDSVDTQSLILETKQICLQSEKSLILGASWLVLLCSPLAIKLIINLI